MFNLGRDPDLVLDLQPVSDANGIVDCVYVSVVQASDAVALVLDNSLKNLNGVAGNYCFKRR